MESNKFKTLGQANSNLDKFFKIDATILELYLKDKPNDYILNDSEIDALYYKTQIKESELLKSKIQNLKKIPEDIRQHIKNTEININQYANRK